MPMNENKKLKESLKHRSDFYKQSDNNTNGSSMSSNQKFSNDSTMSSKGLHGIPVNLNGSEVVIGERLTNDLSNDEETNQIGEYYGNLSNRILHEKFLRDLIDILLDKAVFEVKLLFSNIFLVIHRIVLFFIF